MVLLDSLLISLLDKYSDGSTLGLGSALAQSLGRIKDSECVVPVLGMQGKGKSTLLNGILGVCALPAEVDETTCVPVEIRYGSTESAKIHFKSGANPVQLENSKDIELYVDNVYNPGNEKGVDHVVLTENSKILEHGLTLVDLPGVGSLTYANEETTMRYLKKVLTGIFVTGVVPPMKGTERVFVKSCWTQFPYAIFVQNSRGDSDREIRQATDHNTKELRNIAESISASFDEADLFTVNARDAIDEDQQLRKASGIKTLQARLEKLVMEWNSAKLDYFDKRINIAIEQTEKKIVALIEECHKSAEDAKFDRYREYVEFHNQTKDLRKKFQKYRESVKNKERESLEYSGAPDKPRGRGAAASAQHR